MTTFADLGVEPDLVAALASQGILTPFPIQAATIPDAIEGRDLCGKAKTGSGKTLAFGLPLLMRTPPAEAGHPTALVLLPTRELAVQVEAVIDPLAASRDMTSRTFYGGTALEKDLEALKRRVDVAIGTPGRLIDLVQQGALHLDAVKVLVLDEADRMADMGFMPQVEWLVRHIETEHQTLLFSATLDGDVDRLVKHYQNDPVRHEIMSDTTTVDAMQHRFLYVHQMDKPKVAATIGRASNRTLVFVRTKRGADRLVEQLLKEGIKAAAIHGDLRQAARERSLARFTEGKLPVLVATDVAARGLHIDAVDVVVHFDPPEDHKTYLHRSGRTARAGATGVAVTLVLWDQLLEVTKLQKRLQLQLPIVETFSNDPNLEDLAAWEPDPAKSVVPANA
jgi:superfamily II DNA/RNA helicase